MTTDIERLETGVPGFDELLSGGLPRDRLTLVTGRSGTGKTVLSLQMSCSMAREGNRVVYFSLEDGPDDLTVTGEQLGFETARLVKARMLCFVDLRLPTTMPIYFTGEFDVSGLISRMVSAINDLKANIIVIDSLTALVSPLTEPMRMRTILSQLIATMSSHGTLIVTSEARNDYDRITRFGVEEFLADTVVVLRNLIDGKRRRRTIEVHKYRRSDHLKGEYPCTMSHEGMVVFPLDISGANERAESREIERYPTGVEGLDELSGGGWLRDSIVLLRGPTGSGKTILSGTFAVAAAERGEKVLLYGFEETENIIIRNLERLHIPIKEALDGGNLRLVARFPEATSPEDMIIELRRILDEFSPSILVLDSISAIEHVSSYETFRQFVIGLTSVLRQKGRSALLTQSVAATEDIERQAPYLSTLADSILVLGYDLSQEPMQRSARMVKMRGSRHSLHSHGVDIDDQGIHIAIEPLYTSQTATSGDELIGPDADEAV